MREPNDILPFVLNGQSGTVIHGVYTMGNFKRVNRRTYLKSVGTLGAGSTLSLAGCAGRSGQQTNDETPTPDDETPTPESNGGEYEAARTPAVEEIPAGGTGVNLELVGHNPLLDEHQYEGDSFGIPRGSNGDITIAGDYVYVGSFIGHQPPLIVDVSDPTSPEVVGPVPDAVPGVANGVEGIEASGDVLVIAQRRPLGGLGFDVPEGMPERGLAVYDISEPREPELVARFDHEGLDTHALTLWRDPEDPERLLGVHTMEEGSDIRVIDLTGCPDGDCEPELVAEWDLETQVGIETPSHEAIMSTDGERIYVAQYGAGVLVLDSSNLLASLRDGTECDPSAPDSMPGDGHCLTAADPELVASLEAQPDLPGEWQHTPLKVPDRSYLLAAAESRSMEWDDETGAVRKGPCPGARIRTFELDADNGVVESDPVGTYGVPEQDEENCESDGWVADTVAEPAWLSPHFPLAFHDLAFSTYYGAGFRAIDISDPATPVEVGHFFNEPVEEVRWASHGLQGEREYGDDDEPVRQHLPQPHMFAFSYPIAHEGYLIYADTHSGLYVLEYTGPHADQIPDEGNCLSANPGAIEPGYEPCPPYGAPD